MPNTLYTYELSLWSRNRSIYLYAIVFLCIALVSFIGSAGFFDGPAQSTGIIAWVNSASSLQSIFQYFNKFLLFLIPTIIGVSIHKDVQSKMHKVLYSYPIHAGAFLRSRFLSACTIVLLISLSIGLGFIIGEHFPGLDEQKLGPFSFSNYSLHLYNDSYTQYCLYRLWCSQSWHFHETSMLDI